jgi:hypothetical protein
MKRALLLALAPAVLAAGCGSFEDPAIVIDLRVLGMSADPPEQLVPYDPANPPDPSTIQLDPVEICALIAEPGVDRPLDYVMTACPPTGDGRCDPTEPGIAVGGGTIDDPETAAAPQVACAQLDPSTDLFAVITQAIKDDPLAGFDHVDIQVVMRVNPVGATPDEAIWATKAVRFGAQVPAERQPNHNPTLTELDGTTPDGTVAALAPGRCVDQAAPVEVGPGEDLAILPVEPAGAREDYVVPTFDGGEQHLTENLSYEWLAGAGKWKRSSTGGPTDPFGNDPQLDTVWTAPAAADVGDGLDVSLWVIQRDERLGEAWSESCVHVHP